MSGYKRVNFYELCRLCATNQQKEKTHIFQEEGRKMQLQNKIQSCLSLKVCENDFLPKVVCSQCLTTLEECYTFRKECQGSETMLSSYFNNFRYTEDFKKSGKVYIKDTTPKTNIQPATSSVSTPTPNATGLNDLSCINMNYTNVTENSLPDLSLVTQNNLPSYVNSKMNSKIDTIHSKVIQPNSSQPQVAYNLNTLNIEVLKNILQNTNKNDTVANITVNANGEIIGIGPIVNFDALLAQSGQKLNRNVDIANKPVVQVRKRQKPVITNQKRSENASFLDDPVIKIDLTDNEPILGPSIDQKIVCSQPNKISFAYKPNESYKSSQNAIISVPDINSSQLVPKFLNSSQIPQVNTKMQENDTNQVYSTNSNVGYSSHLNTNSINVMSNISLQNVNFNALNNPSLSSNNFNSNLTNTNVNYNNNVNQGNNLAQSLPHLQQNGISKVQNAIHRKNYPININQNTNISNLDLTTHIDTTVMDKNNFNVLNMNLASINTNLINNYVKVEDNHNNTLHNTTNTSKNHNKINNLTNIISSQAPNHLQDNLDLNTNCPLSVTPSLANQLNAAPQTTTSSSVMATVDGQNSSACVKSHMCEICKKSFKRKEHLYQHVKLHSGFRPFRCDSCNKCFMRKEHLLRHLTAHSGAKNFTCNICEKSFSRNDNLLKHKKTHEKQSKFTCQVCQKHFVMKHYYLAHKLTHETDRCNVNQLWGVLKA